MRSSGLGSEDGYYKIYPDGKDGTSVIVYCDLTLGADYHMCDDCNGFWRFSPSDWLQTLSYSFDWHPNVGYCDEGHWRHQDADSLEECWRACVPSAAGSSYSYAVSYSFSYSSSKQCFVVEDAYCEEYAQSYHNMGGGGMTQSYSTAEECMNGCNNHTSCTRGYFYAPAQYCYFFGIDGYADTCTWNHCGDCTGFECDPSSGDFHYGGNYYDGGYYTYGGDDDDFATACVNWNPEEEQCYCMGEWSDDDHQIDTSDYCVRGDDSNWGVAVPRGTAFPGDCDYDDDSYEHECPSGLEPIIPRTREHWAR